MTTTVDAGTATPEKGNITSTLRACSPPMRLLLRSPCDDATLIPR